MKRLKQLRMQRNIRQKEIADYLGITVSAYGNYELGQRQPNFETLCKMADFFNVSVDYLLGRDEKQNNPSSQYQLNYFINDIQYQNSLKLFFLWADLNPEHQKTILHMIEFFHEIEHKK